MERADDASPDPRVELRIALLVDTFGQPRWVYRAIQAIQVPGLARIVLVVQRDAPPGPGPWVRAWRALAHAGSLVYSAIDDWFFRRETDALAPVSIEPLLENIELLRIPAIRSRGDQGIRDSDVRAIADRRLDVALAFVSCPVGAGSASLARLGTWSFRTEPADGACAGPPGFWEVMQGRPVTETTLESVGGSGGPRALYRSFSATDPFSVRRNRDHACSKAATFVARVLRELGDRQTPPLMDDAGHSPPASSRDATRCPGNLEMLRFGAQLAGKFVGDRLWRLRFEEQWAIVVSPTPRPSSASGLTYLRPPRDRSWADPFPVRRGDDLFIFMEEIPRDTRKGHISVLALDRRGSWQPPVKVLERDHHLAYPFVFEWEREVYMIPETRANRTVELYRCRGFPESWTLEKVLLRDLNASDATLHEIEGRWWMFVNVAAEGAQNTWDELHLYHANSPLGPWSPHRRNPVKSDVRSARPAGRLFREADGLYRPAQDCSRRYGHSIVLHKVTRIDPEDYAEMEIFRILPDWGRSLLATHTYNRADNLTVLDCLLRRPRIL